MRTISPLRPHRESWMNCMMEKFHLLIYSPLRIVWQPQTQIIALCSFQFSTSCASPTARGEFSELESHQRRKYESVRDLLQLCFSSIPGFLRSHTIQNQVWWTTTRLDFSKAYTELNRLAETGTPRWNHHRFQPRTKTVQNGIIALHESNRRLHLPRDLHYLLRVWLHAPDETGMDSKHYHFEPKQNKLQLLREVRTTRIV
jgi:hypothetical protein